MATHTTTLNMKQKNLIEISEETLTALVIVRQKNGQIDFAAAKGHPHLFEMMTMLFGVFTSMVKSLDQIQVGNDNGGEKVRSMFKEHSLEECREILATTTNVFYALAKEDMDNE